MRKTVESNNTGFFAVVASVLAGIFGVQSHKNYERDFTKGTFISYLIVGIVMVALLVISLFALVKWVSST